MVNHTLGLPAKPISPDVRASSARLASAASALTALGCPLVAPTEANGVFVEFAPATVAALEARGWHFYPFVGAHGYRLMCSWETADADIAAFLTDARAALGK